MRKLLRYLFLKPILWLTNKFSSSPDRYRIYTALSKLKDRLYFNPGKKGFVIPLDFSTSKFIIFSDQHKGAKNGADDFMLAEPNYIAALDYYNEQSFHLICLGDSEELWENLLIQVKKNNQPSFEAERKFASRKAFTKIFGNHDLDWEINPMATTELEELYGSKIAVLEAVLLQTGSERDSFTIFCTHGHQGDAQSDGNFFSKFFVSNIWAPVQAYLRINPNTPAYNATLKTEHNNMMYEWSSQHNNLVLITGHTHQPVFESLTHLERIQREEAKKEDRDNPFTKVKPSYFNTGCCCFDDGDITGIEISHGMIRLVKWEANNGISQRVELEKTELATLAARLG
jgi:predicted phosphodiesterase